jgi:DNA ligase-1
MLFTDDLDKFIKNIKSVNDILWSDKLDGVRTWAVVEKEKIYYLSRNNKLFPNFSVFDEYLRNMVDENNLKYPFIFDGEVCSSDRRFSNVMTQIHRLNEIDASIFRFHIFDLPISGKSFEQRYSLLKHLMSSYRETTPSVDKDKNEKIFIVPQRTLKSVSTINFDNIKLGLKELMDSRVRIGYEGIVLRDRTSNYDFGKRSVHGCKLKQVLSLDLKVIGAELGEGRNKHRLGALICEYKGNEIKIGGGYTDKQREEFIKNPPKAIEVSFKGFTSKGMLREPVFLRVREDKDVHRIMPRLI